MATKFGECTWRGQILEMTRTRANPQVVLDNLQLALKIKVEQNIKQNGAE